MVGTKSRPKLVEGSPRALFWRPVGFLMEYHRPTYGDRHEEAFSITSTALIREVVAQTTAG